VAPCPARRSHALNQIMPISPARVAAFEILLRVERESAYAPELLHGPRYTRLSAADHGLATELLMGVLRWRSRLDAHIAEQSSQKLGQLDLEVLIALRLGCYQLDFLSRVPQRAAVHESVELVKRARKRSAAPFVNAILRKLAAKSATRPLAEDVTTPAALAAASAHPLWLVERWTREFGFHSARQVCAYDQAVPETALRLYAPEAEAELQREGVALAPGRLLTTARRAGSGEITKTRAFREGRVAIQDEASQLVALLVGHGQRILDCCAAPGGKTRMLAGQNPQAKITAVELHSQRVRLLQKLLFGKKVEIVTSDVCALPGEAAYDRVLADVPCSGTGTLARNPEIKWRLQPQDFADLQQRQLAILRSAMRQAAPGGRIVYSTCSLEPEENSAVVEMALAAEPGFSLCRCREELQRFRSEGELAVSDLDSLIQGPYLRTIPGVHPCDGFFAAILKRNQVV